MFFHQIFSTYFNPHYTQRKKTGFLKPNTVDYLFMFGFSIFTILLQITSAQKKVANFALIFMLGNLLLYTAYSLMFFKAKYMIVTSIFAILFCIIMFFIEVWLQQNLKDQNMVVKVLMSGMSLLLKLLVLFVLLRITPFLDLVIKIICCLILSVVFLALILVMISHKRKEISGSNDDLFSSINDKIFKIID